MDNGSELNFASLPYRLIRRRWWIIAPVVATMSLILAYTRSVDLYRSQGIVRFSTDYVLADSDAQADRIFDDKINRIISSLRYGEPVRAITLKVWPHLNLEKDPVTFNSRAQSLISKSGLELSFRRDDFRALTIAYTSRDPNEAHAVVQATIETLMDEARSISERRMTNSSSFLKNEIEERKRNLSELNQEINRLETGFGPVEQPRNYTASLPPEDEKQNKPTTLAVPLPLAEGGLLPARASYRENLSSLKFELTVAQKELERLKERMAKKDYLSGGQDLEAVFNFGDDEILRDLRTTLADRERQRQMLSSQGLLGKHPKRRALEAEIMNLKQLEEKRQKEILESRGAEGQELVKLKLEGKLRAQISEKNDQISVLSDKIAVFENYQEEINSNKDELASQLDVFSVQRSRLEQLKQKKEILNQAYQNAVMELEILNRQGMAEEGDVGMRISVAEEPEIPKAPIPLAHLSTIIMGFVLSSAVGAALIFAVDALDTSVVGVKELRDISGLNVAGEIDKFVTAEERGRVFAIKLGVVSILLTIIVFARPIVRTFFL